MAQDDTQWVQVTQTKNPQCDSKFWSQKDPRRYCNQGDDDNNDDYDDSDDDVDNDDDDDNDDNAA